MLKDWVYLKEQDCYFMERVPYCLCPEVPEQQCMNIYVPAVFLTGEGKLTEKVHENGFTASTVPVIFENGLAGYMEAEPFDLEDGRSGAKDFLQAGFVYVSCGCRGRSSRDARGKGCGKSPLSLVDLKAGIRFLKHYAGVLPGDMKKIISVGISAGGAMSTLLGSTGNSENYEKELQRAGAFMEETDDIFGTQCYCPIIDLDHADLAYEWMFRGKTHYTGMPFVGFGEGDLTPFAAALSDRLADAYVEYFNGLGLRHPVSGEPVQIGKEHEGSGYTCLMEKLEESAAKYLKKLERGEELSGPKIPATEAGDYIRGCYEAMNFDFPSESLVSVSGIDKSGWLSWDGTKARIAGLDQMQETYHRRLKLCPSFDDLNLIQAENQELGTPDCDKMHFNPLIAPLMEQLQSEFPRETSQYLEDYQKISDDKELAQRRYLINPMNYIGTEEKADLAPHYRIRVGSRDADTSLMITLTLALKLMNTGRTDVDYEIVWDEPHGRADYPGEVAAWVQKICANVE